MQWKNSWRSIWIGTVSGALLAILLKAAEALTGKKVYTLLLNVDYIPILKDYQFTELTEVSFHLLISIIICGIIIQLFMRSGGTIRRQIVVLSLFANVFIGMMLYPTVLLSDRTPEFTDAAALFLWLAGHAVYGWAAGFLVKRSAGAEETPGV